MAGELVLAGLQFATRPGRKYSGEEDERLIDHPFPRQQIGNLLVAEPARNVDDLVARERPCRFEALLGDEKMNPPTMATSTSNVNTALPAMTEARRTRLNAWHASVPDRSPAPRAARWLRGVIGRHRIGE